jgi:hypothetical protein
MPVPRLFEAATDPREQWAHVVASLLGITTSETRAALLAELVGDVVEGAGGAQVAERRPFTTDGGPVVADVVVRSGSSWGVAIQCDLAFDVDRSDRWRAVYDALAAAVETPILVAVTPDRRRPADVTAAAKGRDIRHRSWLRVRDWVQERPERGGVTGTDAVLLREAEYFLTPRVAELYRLEGLMPLMRPEVREPFAGLFFELNDLAPQPTILNPTDRSATIRYPRTGDALVTVAVGDGDPVLEVPGTEPLTISSPETYRDARSSVQAAARAALPPRR